MTRVIAYIDGYNLYYGLRTKGWKWAYWLNLQSLMSKFLKPGQVLVQTKYFTTIVASPHDKRIRQATYLEALQTLSDFPIFYGHFLSNTVICLQCGHTYTAHHEKMTDVNIATELLVDAFADRFDIAFLLTADSDLAAPVKAVQSITNKHVLVIFPPERSSKQLMLLADGYQYISRSSLNKSLFPDEITKPNGYILRRPKSWR